MNRGRGRSALRRPRTPSTRKVGLPPGTVLYTGSAHETSHTVDLIVYGPDGCLHRRGIPIEEALLGHDDGRVRWIDVVGLHDAAGLERIGEALGLHALTLEDVASVGQRPKMERYDDYLYLVLRMITSHPTTAATQPLARGAAPPRLPALDDEQLSLVLSGSVVVTFQERPGDVLGALRDRLAAGKGRARSLGADYLAYAIVDLVVDHYFHVLEQLSDALEALESTAFAGARPRLIDDVHVLKRDLLHLRRTIWPTRELLSGLLRDDDDRVTPAVRTYLRDAHDHAVQVLETVELLRETTNSVHEIYLAGLTVRMNEVMKLLTIIATIFIPLTFVVGVYGMNFERMPELTWRWGYGAVWLVMLTSAVSMLFWFRRRGWL
ncbi:magnesium/cobalt transporter CorA [soil metagenome]